MLYPNISLFPDGWLIAETSLNSAHHLFFSEQFHSAGVNSSQKFDVLIGTIHDKTLVRRLFYAVDLGTWHGTASKTCLVGE